MTIGMNVTAYNSRCIGFIIDSETITGHIVKINKKSIIVDYDYMVVKKGHKVTYEGLYSGTSKFTYWKTLSDRTVCYKNQVYGIIKVTE